MLTVFLTILAISFTPKNCPLPTTKFTRDPFGYYYLDSDTSAPNAPIYNWISIYGRGTQVTGLGDDYVKGPFPIGFNFPFYWEQENNVYIGSNGYLSFDDNFLSAYPFQSLPNLKRPDNILAPLMTDLNFNTGTPSCWYWTNSAADTFIVEFDSVQFWSTNGLSSFQIILSRRDSSITFQYRIIDGEPYGGWLSSNSNTVGIENCIGNIGLQYLKDGLPLQNQLHNSLAIKFFRPNNSTYEIYDAKVLNVINTYSGAVFIEPGDSIRFWARTKNCGNRATDETPIVARVNDQIGNQVYFDTTTLGCRVPGMVDSIAFSSWMPSITGRYCLKVKTALSFDMCPTNDSVTVEMRVINYPSEMQYDDGLNSGLSLNKPGGFANQFIPTRYPIRISGAKIYASSSPPTDIAVSVYRDNGPGQSPGDVLTTTSVNINSPNWYTIYFSPQAIINSGSFYIGAISTSGNRPIFGVDALPPFSRRLWEYTGAGNWSLSRFSLSNDICIRALATTGIEELPTENLITSFGFVLPNPFNKTTEIRFANPLRETKILRVYNSSGILVRDITTNQESVIWDGKNSIGMELPNGCYFVRFANDQFKSLKKVIIAR